MEGSTVHWDGSPRTTDFISTTQLPADIAASDIAEVGTVYVTVENPGPDGATSNAVPFRIATSPGDLSESVYLPLVMTNSQ